MHLFRVAFPVSLNIAKHDHGNTNSQKTNLFIKLQFSNYRTITYNIEIWYNLYFKIK